MDGERAVTDLEGRRRGLARRVQRGAAYRAGKWLGLCRPRCWRHFERPRAVFIVGMPRSGTTLAKRYLGKHPDLALAPAGTHGETWRFAIGLPPGKLAVIKNTRDLPLVGDIHATYGNEAWFLCVLRDPRDELVSLFETRIHPEIPRDAAFWALWRERHEAFFALARRWGRRGMEAALARYEDLVLRPEKVKGAFLEWLGLPAAELEPEYEPDPELARAPGGAEDWKTHRERRVHTRSLGRWREAADPEWKRVIGLWKEFPAAVQLMGRLGYGEEAGEPTIQVPGVRLLRQGTGVHSAAQRR